MGKKDNRELYSEDLGDVYTDHKCPRCGRRTGRVYYRGCEDRIKDGVCASCFIEKEREEDEKGG